MPPAMPYNSQTHKIGVRMHDHAITVTLGNYYYIYTILLF